MKLIAGLKFKVEERRKNQEAKDEAARLSAEAEMLQETDNVVRDPEAPPNLFLDFVDDSMKFVDSVAEVKLHMWTL